MRSIGQRLFGSAYGTGETDEVLHKAKKNERSPMMSCGHGQLAITFSLAGLAPMPPRWTM
jgi:hypothetical protein